jgi:hypothetical protein
LNKKTRNAQKYLYFHAMKYFAGTLLGTVPYKQDCQPGTLGTLSDFKTLEKKTVGLLGIVSDFKKKKNCWCVRPCI